MMGAYALWGQAFDAFGQTGTMGRLAEIAGNDTLAYSNMAKHGAQIGLEILSNPGNFGVSLGSAVNGYSEALRSGASFDRALANGVFKGLTEYFSNKLFSGMPFEDVDDKGYVTKLIEAVADKMGKSEALQRIVESRGGQALGWFTDKVGEGLEEVVTGLLDPAIDWATLDADYEIDSLAEEFVGGVVLSLLMGGGEALVNNVNTARTGRDYNLDEDTVRALLGEGLAAEEGSRSRALAEQYSAMLDGGQGLSNWQVGRQVRANEADIAAGRISENEQAEADRAEVQRYYDALGLEMPEATNAQLAPQEKTGYNDNVNMLLDAMAANSRAEEEIARRFRLLSLYEEGRLGKAAAQETELAGVVPYSESSALMAPFPAATASFRAAGGVGPYSVETNPSVSASADSSPARGARGMNGKEILNGRGSVLSRSGERNDGQSAGEQAGKLEKGTGRDQGRDEGRKGAAARSADGEASHLTHGEAVSSASLGVAKGSANDRIYLVTGGETAATKAAKAMAKKHGLQLVLFTGGNLHVDGVGEVRGYISGDRVFIRADHPYFTADQITRHEVGHQMIREGEIDQDAVRERIADLYGEDGVRSVAELYASAYAGMTAEEAWEEIICDSLGDMNVFSGVLDAVAKPYQQYLETVKAATENSARSERGPPSEESRASRENKRRAQRGRSIEIETMENNRFERLRQFHDDLPAEWYAYTLDYFYVYSNQSFMDYTILVKARITENNRAAINLFMEALENGSYRSAETFDRWTKDFRRGKGRNSWHSVRTGNAGTARSDDGVDVRARGRVYGNDSGTGGKADGNGLNDTSMQAAEELNGKASREIEQREADYLAAVERGDTELTGNAFVLGKNEADPRMGERLTENQASHPHESASAGTVSQADEKGKTVFSSALRIDTKGRELSERQREYFAESKAVDRDRRTSELASLLQAYRDNPSPTAADEYKLLSTAFSEEDPDYFAVLGLDSADRTGSTDKSANASGTYAGKNGTPDRGRANTSKLPYWKPHLNRAEWDLLNRTLDREIGSTEQFLDKYTKWLYKSEKGTSVFAIYGIGDGTDPTPLYATGGKTALRDYAKLQKYYQEVCDGQDYGNRATLDWLLEIIKSKRGN